MVGRDAAVKRTDTAGGHRKIKLAERIADGKNTVAHGDIVAVADRGRSQIRCVDLQHGNVVVLVEADDLGFVARFILEQDADLVAAFLCRLDNVIVRQYISVGGYYKSGSGDRACAPLAEYVGIGAFKRNAHCLPAAELVYLVCRGGFGADLLDVGRADDGFGGITGRCVGCYAAFDCVP